jgi:hypothetical protein
VAALASAACGTQCLDECGNDSNQDHSMQEKKSKNNPFHFFRLPNALKPPVHT